MPVISYLMGGCANNLFQIAASVGAADFYGNEYKVQSDFPHKDYFSIPETAYVDSYALPRYTEPRFDYYSIPQGDLQLFGYFQSEKYFKHCQNQIRKLFSAPDKIKEKIKYKYSDLLAKNTCAVHVRRGDYLKLKDYHYNLELDYYLKAMQAFPDFHFVCFSDDIKWCKENIPAQEFIRDHDMVEFHLMSYCKNFIIANSTFSWWASWLSQNKDKIIIAPSPKCWFGEKKKHLNVSDLYCENWIYETK